MKVLVTGGCGFLGSNLASSFLKKGDEVVIIDNLSREGSEKNLKWLQLQAEKGQLHFFKNDICKQSSTSEIFEECKSFDYVCHVAGQVAMTTSLSDPRTDMNTNVIGTFNILECVRKYCNNALIAYSSTNKVYGDLEWIKTKETKTRYVMPEYSRGINETIPLDFSTPYGCSKGAADQYVKEWGRVYGLNTVVFRHSSIYGGRQYASFDQGWVGWFCKKAIEQKQQRVKGTNAEHFTISGTGKQVRDVLHANDLVSLYQLAYKNKDRLHGEVFNIGGGVKNSLSLIELFNHLAKSLELEELRYNKLPRRSSDQDSFIACIDKAQEKLGWYPQWNYEDGIDKMIEWTVEIDRHN